jgi:hypothetical protein
MRFGCRLALLESAFLRMAEIVQDTQQEFWRSPTVVEPAVEATLPAASEVMPEACADCGGEFMIGARFCHTCGRRRRAMVANNTDAAFVAGIWARKVAWVRECAGSAGAAWAKISLPAWVEYLHFHKIKRWIGLPTAALIAFLIGLGCVAGAIGVSLFYKASTLAEFQAIQMWRIEWLLAATASFVAGILLKKPSDTDND